MIEKIIKKFPAFQDQLAEYRPAGYTIALNIWNVTPELYHSTFPEDWVLEYTENNYAMVDPVVQFTATSHGIKRWSEIKPVKLPWNVDVLSKARSFNLNYGVVIVKKSKLKRRKHMLSLAKSGGEFSDTEILEISNRFEEVLSELHPKDHLTERQIAILSCMAKGLTGAETAQEIGTSIETVKRELETIRTILKAPNTVAAVAAAVARKLVFPQDGPRW